MQSTVTRDDWAPLTPFKIGTQLHETACMQQNMGRCVLARLRLAYLCTCVPQIPISTPPPKTTPSPRPSPISVPFGRRFPSTSLPFGTELRFHTVRVDRGSTRGRRPKRPGCSGVAISTSTAVAKVLCGCTGTIRVRTFASAHRGAVEPERSIEGAGEVGLRGAR